MIKMINTVFGIFHFFCTSKADVQRDLRVISLAVGFVNSIQNKEKNRENKREFEHSAFSLDYALALVYNDFLLNLTVLVAEAYLYKWIYVCTNR